ncbi:MAG: WD40 repeat-like protein [Cirrosporium novae-zelandiae]|nr:MAG: WD40 repeat-like protein [Cirrosporium novae-zelandiae]
MGLFSRRAPVDEVANGETANRDAVNARHHHGRREKHYDSESGYLNRRPSFGQWLKMTWLDILTMAAMGAVGLGVYEAHPAPSRSFPVDFQDGEIVYPEFAYPLRNEIIPIWLAALLGSLIPIAVILFMQIRIRSFWDVNNGVIGLLYSLITAAVFQVFLKWLIGGLRPHFLDVCKPDVSLSGAQAGNGFRQIMYDRTICTGDQDEIDDSLESFPSGHSTAAFAGFMYLYLYLNAKLKVWSNYHPAMWKLLAVYAPVLGATLIAGALTIDKYHNWYDCVAGAVIGTMMAFSSYRMVYASVWDFRFNHIPLTRNIPFSYGAEPGAGGFESAIWTRKAGWGHEDGAYGGAPFDSARGGGTASATEGYGGASHMNRKPVAPPAHTHGHGDNMV